MIDTVFTEVEMPAYTPNPEFPIALQAVRDAHKVLLDAAAKFEGDLGELFDADFNIPAHLLAQILMNHLPIDGMGFVNKSFWFEVGNYMGPDYLRSMRHVAAFMTKVDEF